MRVQLVYRCRFCRRDELRDGGALEGLERTPFNLVLVDIAEQSIVHDCSASGSHVGVCDLVGAVVTEGVEG